MRRSSCPPVRCRASLGIDIYHRNLKRIGRRTRFRAIETQLEIAEALIRENFVEVQRLIRDTLSQMGVTEEQMREFEAELRRQLRQFGGPDLPPLDLGERDDDR